MILKPMSDLPPEGSPFADATLFVMRLDGPKDLRGPYNEFGLVQFSKRLTFGEWRWGRIAELVDALANAPVAPQAAGEEVKALREEREQTRELILEVADALTRIASGKPI